jgi:hypothetical protein
MPSPLIPELEIIFFFHPTHGLVRINRYSEYGSGENRYTTHAEWVDKAYPETAWCFDRMARGTYQIVGRTVHIVLYENCQFKPSQFNILLTVINADHPGYAHNSMYANPGPNGLDMSSVRGVGFSLREECTNG